MVDTSGSPEDSEPAAYPPSPPARPYRARDLPPIPVKRGTVVGRGRIDSGRGGVIVTSDGLTLRAAAGALDRDREILVHSAQATPPAMKAGRVGEEAVTLRALCAWDIEGADSDDLLPGELEAEIELREAGQSGPPPGPFLLFMSFDGKTWTPLAHTIQNDRLCFRTRHCSTIVVLGAPTLAGLLVYYLYSCNELPELTHEDAPFITLGAPNMWMGIQGIPLFWSTKLTPDKSGLKDLASFRRAEAELLQRLRGEYGDLERGLGAIQYSAQIWSLAREHLMPDEVKRIEDAFRAAQAHLDARGFQKPFFNVRVFVTNRPADASAEMSSPLFRQDYITLSAHETDAARLQVNALHELFHHYQTSYVWKNSNAHLPMMEASALLLEREAVTVPLPPAVRPPFDDQRLRLGEGLVLAQFAACRHGLEGPVMTVFSDDPMPPRRFGYGLSWFLEYLRERRSGGDPPRRASFHRELLETWKWRGLVPTLRWAAGDDARKLGEAWLEFARTQVLVVDPRGSAKGSDSPFGRAYGTSPLADAPFEAQTALRLAPAGAPDFGKDPLWPIGDLLVKNLSIQFFGLQPPPRRDRAILVARVPAAWFGNPSPGRGVFARTWDGKRAFVEIPRSKGSEDASLAGPFTGLGDLYVVDTGQTEAGSLEGKPLLLYLLEPPPTVRGQFDPDRRKVRISWDAPPVAADSRRVISAYRVYSEGRAAPLAEVADSTSVDIDLSGITSDRVRISVTTLDTTRPPNESLASRPIEIVIPAAPKPLVWRRVEVRDRTWKKAQEENDEPDTNFTEDLGEASYTLTRRVGNPEYEETLTASWTDLPREIAPGETVTLKLKVGMSCGCSGKYCSVGGSLVAIFPNWGVEPPSVEKHPSGATMTGRLNATLHRVVKTEAGGGRDEAGFVLVAPAGTGGPGTRERFHFEAIRWTSGDTSGGKPGMTRLYEYELQR